MGNFDFLEGDLINKVVDGAKKDAQDFGASSESQQQEHKEEPAQNAGGQDSTSSEEQNTHQQPHEERKKTATVDGENTGWKGTPEDNLTDKDKKRNVLYCRLQIVIISEVVDMTAQIIAGEFDQPNKYRIKQTSQKEISELWAEMLNLEGKTKSPKKGLTTLIIGTMIPIYLTAIRTAWRKKRAKKRNKEQGQESARKTEESFNNNSQTEQPKEKPKPPPVHNDVEEAEIIQDETGPMTYQAKEKGTAEVEVHQTVVEDEPDRVPGKRGRKAGKAKNPQTDNYEHPVKIITRSNGKPYFVYSWGEVRIVPPKYRNNLEQFKKPIQ